MLRLSSANPTPGAPARTALGGSGGTLLAAGRADVIPAGIHAQHHKEDVMTKLADVRIESAPAAGAARRAFLKSGVAAGAAVALALTGSRLEAAGGAYADPEKPALPPSTMVLDRKRTALVVTDPQIDFLSPKGVTWGVEIGRAHV